MAKSPLQIQRDKMIELSTPYVKKMMQDNSLSVKKVEILSLVLAAQHGFCEMMQVLLTTGKADVNLADPSSGNTALHYAVFNGQLLMVKLLTSSGAKNIPNKAKQTPKDMAKTKHSDIYSFLCTIYEEPDHKDAIKLSGESHVSVDDDA
ncbi:MAG: ankyrin repeat domain-containing protein [Rickettsiales bacterium]|nr:ankyrin repeat domain-containing protein [Rickettsiales bacterium]MCA0253992.1 ankyrin repeat domain-containing protein [Pseudomonadota bacterium]